MSTDQTPIPAAGWRWIIRKRPDENPGRPWQLWLSNGEAMSLKAERSCWSFCVQVMNRLKEAGDV